MVKISSSLVISLLGVISFQCFADELATVSINPDKITGPVNRLILGTNVLGFNARFNDKGNYGNYGAGIWDAARETPVQEYVDLARTAGVSIIRWPGGNHSRTMNWKEAIGPISKRVNQRFGLPEFLTFCKAVGAQPLIVVANNVGSESDAADLVEYLNGANDGSNANDGIDWAALRAEDGHAKPIEARWFILGNETFHTNMSAATYAKKYLAYQAAMKSVDAHVLLGAVLEDANNEAGGWTENILTAIGDRLDFGDFHPYFPKVDKKNANFFSGREIALASVSAGRDLEARISGYQKLVRRTTNLQELPLIAGEYNGLFVQDLPFPYRQTLVNAIHNADFIRRMLEPGSPVKAALFWQFSNAYWGAVTGYPQRNQQIIKQANFYIFELFNKYLGTQIVETKIKSPQFDFDGCCSVSARVGAVVEDNSAVTISEGIPNSWSRRPFVDGNQNQSAGIVSVQFNGEQDLNYFHAKKEISVEPNTLYRISVKVRSDKITNGKVGIEVQDARGWKNTFSRAANMNVSGTTPWHWVTLEYRTLIGAERIKILARRYPGNGKIKGAAYFGDMKVERLTGNFGMVRAIDAISSIDEEGNLYTLLLNKSIDEEIDVSIRVGDIYQLVSAEILSGKAATSGNYSKNSDKYEVVLEQIRWTKEGHNAKLVLPPLSLTGASFLAR